MGQPAARVLDMHTCPMVTGVVPHVGGPILPPCKITVLTGMFPQARVTDMCMCVGPPDVIVKGAMTVLVGGLPAARMGDSTAHGGVIVVGMPTVLIGDSNSGSAGQTSQKVAMPKMGLEKSGSDSKSQIETMIAASQKGTPFCEQCWRAAHGMS